MSVDIYEQAHCINAPTEWFYDSTLYTEVVRAFCAQCPIREQCLKDWMVRSGAQVYSAVFHRLDETSMQEQTTTS